MRRLLVNLAVAAAILTLMEGACRLTERSPKYRYDEMLGYRLVPGTHDEDETINSAGLRGPELGDKTPGTFRILAMGGSTTFGSHVPDDGTWPFQLQRALRAAGHGQAEVLNGAVNGWGLEQIVLALEHDYLDRLQPDLVLVYSGWNHAAIKDSPTITKYLLKSKTSPVKSGIFHSAFVRWLDKQLLKLTAPDRTEDRVERWENKHEIMQAAFPPLVAQLADVCRRRGVTVAMIRYPAFTQVPLVEGAIESKRLAGLLNQEDYPGLEVRELYDLHRRHYEEQLEVVVGSAAAAGIPVLDVAGRMTALVDVDGTPEGFVRWRDCFADRMHKTPRGNAVLADGLGQLLLEQGLLTGDPSPGTPTSGD